MWYGPVSDPQIPSHIIWVSVGATSYGYLLGICGCVIGLTGWRRDIGCLRDTGHFPQKSPIISGSFAKNDHIGCLYPHIPSHITSHTYWHREISHPQTPRRINTPTDNAKYHFVSFYNSVYYSMSYHSNILCYKMIQNDVIYYVIKWYKMIFRIVSGCIVWFYNIVCYKMSYHRPIDTERCDTPRLQDVSAHPQTLRHIRPYHFIPLIIGLFCGKWYHKTTYYIILYHRRISTPTDTETHQIISFYITKQHVILCHKTTYYIISYRVTHLKIPNHFTQPQIISFYITKQHIIL